MQQSRWAKLPAVIATQTNPKKSTLHLDPITRTMQAMSEYEAQYTHPRENTSVVIQYIKGCTT